MESSDYWGPLHKCHCPVSNEWRDKRPHRLCDTFSSDKTYMEFTDTAKEEDVNDCNLCIRCPVSLPFSSIIPSRLDPSSTAEWLSLCV